MKSLNFKLFLAFISLFFYGGNAYSQEKKSLFKDCLWIKNEKSEIKSVSHLTNDDNDLKRYFNFNPVVDFSKDKIVKKYKKIVTKTSSLFVVFKSASKEENILFLMERGSFNASISNQKIVSDKEVSLNKGDSKKGVIVSYLYNKNSLIGKKKGNLIFGDQLFEDSESINQLVELIYIPRCIGSKEKEKIESYLSLKYGISLNEGQSYFNSKGDKIWDPKQNEGFNNRITGIGKDSFFELNQKQSKNSLEDGLSVGLDKIKKTNSENEVFLKDKDFLLWGDNGKTIALGKSPDTPQKKIERLWKIKTFSESITNYNVQIKIDKKLMPIEPNFDIRETDFFWIAIDNSGSSEFNYTNAKYIKATTNNENEIVFDNVEFMSNSDYLFTIVKAKDNPNNLDSNAISTFPKIDEFQNNFAGQFKLYPNPIIANERFTIQFNLKELSKVSIKIADIDGREVKTKDIGIIDNYSFTESLAVSGTYLIMVSVNDKLETIKLIVK